MEGSRVDVELNSSICIAFNNIRSLRNKVRNVECDVKTLGAHLFFLVETMLDDTITNGEICMNGFQVFRKDRNIFGGGVAVYVGDILSATEHCLQSDAEAILLEITLNNDDAVPQTNALHCQSSFFLLTFYRPPNSKDNDLVPNLFSETCLKAKSRNSAIFICGDLNFPSISWVDYTTKGGEGPQRLLDSIALLDLEQHVFEPTHIKGNILDVILTSDNCVKSIAIIEPNHSDHCTVVTETCFYSVRSTATMGFKTVYDYSKADLGNVKQIFEELDQHLDAEIAMGSGIDRIWYLFQNTVENIMASCIPSRKVRHGDNLWMNRTLKKALAKQRKAYNQMKRLDDSLYRLKYNVLRKRNRKLIKQSKRSYFNKQLFKPLLEGNSRAFYQHIKTVRSNHDGRIPKLWTSDNRMAVLPKDKAEALNSYFQSVFTHVLQNDSIPSVSFN